MARLVLPKLRRHCPQVCLLEQQPHMRHVKAIVKHPQSMDTDEQRKYNAKPDEVLANNEEQNVKVDQLRKCFVPTR